MPASAPLRFIIANRSALSAISTPRRSGRRTRSRATAFHVGRTLLCQQSAIWVCSGVRAVLFTEPSALTSLKSSRPCGTGERLGDRRCGTATELSIRNGRTSPTHGVGSSICVPSGFSSGCQCPGSEFGTHGDGPKRPSPAVRRSSRRRRRSPRRSRALAAGCPVSPQATSRTPSPAPSKSARPVRERTARRHRRDDVGEDAVRRGRGRGVLRGLRGESGSEEIRAMRAFDGVDGVVDGALAHRHVDLDRRPPLAGNSTSVRVAISFHFATALVCARAPAGAVSAITASAATAADQLRGSLMTPPSALRRLPAVRGTSAFRRATLARRTYPDRCRRGSASDAVPY